MASSLANPSSWKSGKVSANLHRASTARYLLDEGRANPDPQNPNRSRHWLYSLIFFKVPRNDISKNYERENLVKEVPAGWPTYLDSPWLDREELG